MHVVNLSLIQSTFRPTHDVGAVGALRRIKAAISVARKVLENTNHSLIVGSQATKFALEMGFIEESLSSNDSISEWREWSKSDCQPNFRRNVAPDARHSCGPYHVTGTNETKVGESRTLLKDIKDHDTIGMVVIDKQGRMATGTSTNGLIHKIAGRVGDSPVPGSGSYVDQEVGGAAATGDGDVMMRFVPSYHAVELMRSGVSPQDAANDAIHRIAKYYPNFEGAIIVASIKGEYAAACWGLGSFPFSVANADNVDTALESVLCLNS